MDLNCYNKNGETPLIYSIKNDSQYPFLIAEAWNGEEVQIANSTYRTIRKKFDFTLEDKGNGKNCLHYAARTSFLGLTNLILKHSPGSSIQVDDELRLPLHYKDKQYLVSKKCIDVQYRKHLLRHLRKKERETPQSGNEENSLSAKFKMLKSNSNFQDLEPNFCQKAHSEG